MNFRIAAVSLLFLGSTFALTAQAAIVACPNCSEAQYETTARSKGNGEHYIFDYVRNNLRFYSVEWTCSGGGGLPFAMTPGNAAQRAAGSQPKGGAQTNAASPVACAFQIVDRPAIPPSKLDAFSYGKMAFDETHGTMKSIIQLRTDQMPTIPGIGTATAYGFVSDHNQQAMIGREIRDILNGTGATIQSVGNGVAWLMGHADAALGFLDGLQFDVVLTFSDGSQVTYHYNWDTASAQYVGHSARTMAGQLIPDDASGARGTWYFNQPGPTGFQDSLPAFVSFLERMGIPYQSPTGVVTSGLPVAVDCFPGPSGQIICVRKK